MYYRIIYIHCICNLISLNLLDFIIFMQVIPWRQKRLEESEDAPAY